MELELRHLKVVCALSEEGSVTKAAASLGLAQPALSAQLNRIEKSLGGQLFERDHRGVRATPLGDLVLARARVMLPAMSGLREEAARLNNNEGREDGRPEHVNLGSSTGAVLGRLIHALRDKYDDLRVTTQASWSSEELARMLADGRVDFAVVGVCADSPPPVQPGLVWHAVTSDPVFVLLPDTHDLASRAEISLAELSGESWVGTPGDSCFTDCFVTACARAGFTPGAIYEADAASCIDLVETGNAVALCHATRKVPGLVSVPITDTPLRWRQLIGWHPEAPGAAFSDEIVRLTSAACSDLIDRSPVYSSWLEENPGFGVQPLPWATHSV
ncbi:LysR family transcriptional regulator [Aeromicrobium sp.]|uniref:LysR substrate-binding domain-containing protein n=1 Tax=Aeromicrobium sp. TaxID=1871063 RepID=UPI0019B65C9F|nr:LysR family transcriptional regulator [Aeromicrobium sp.]MBC7633957.1 LysR family transcriptional regulator [Aeromicrobium sp.]